MTSGRAERIARSAVAVFVGGALGAAARISLSALQPADAAFPWMTFAINVSGAFALGLLLEYLARTGDDTGRRKLLRLGLGTGACGGFTTYGTFVIELDTRLAQGSVAPALGYGVASLVAGILLAGLGAGMGARMAARHLPPASGDEVR